MLVQFKLQFYHDLCYVNHFHIITTAFLLKYANAIFKPDLTEQASVSL